jgi:ligand-binding sensor protein
MKVIEVIKANKKGIAKKALLIGGGILGLIIAGKVLSSKKDENEEIELIEVPETTETTEEVSETSEVTE